MMKKMRSISAVALIAIVIYSIAVGTTIISHAAEVEDESTAIPVILNYAGDAWIDQNGNSMDMKAAKDFLNNNQPYAWEILYLNGNSQYAVALQNEARSEVISELRKEQTKGSGGMYCNSNASAFTNALQEIIANPPSEDAFNKLNTHLRNNGARDDVNMLQSLCHGGKSTGNVADYLFFGMLAKNYDNGFLDEACGLAIMGTVSPQIPVILLADQKTWLDQNGVLIDQERAEFFLRNNKDYAKKIIRLNQNSYYLPWRSEADDNLGGILWDKFRLSNSEKSRYAVGYMWIMQDILDNPPSIEILEDCCDQLKSHIAANNIAELIDYINGAGSKPKESHIPNYIFWNAVAKATENGNIEIMIDVKTETRGTSGTTPNSKEDTTAPNYDKSYGNGVEPDWSNMTHAEIIKYFDNLGDPETTFDIQHPGLYFDQYGRAHGSTSPLDEYFYATSSGAVYEFIDKNFDPDIIREGSSQAENLIIRYVGQTNRRIK